MITKKSRRLPQIRRKSLLYRTKVEYGDFCINHVEGCSNGCKYPCYAMVMKIRHGIIKSYKDWIRPKTVENALELLEKEIPRYRNQIDFVHLCFSTDPFMYEQAEVASLTLRIIARLNRDNIRCTVLTKGVYPKELAETKKYGKENAYGITVVSLDRDFGKRFEPFSAPFEDRIESLRYLHERELKTWISMEPYPTPNLVRQDLSRILETISFADKIIFGRLNYNMSSSQLRGSEEFYQACANKVTEFCRARGIECHIKRGTQPGDRKQTERILWRNKTTNESEVSSLGYSH